VWVMGYRGCRRTALSHSGRGVYFSRAEIGVWRALVPGRKYRFTSIRFPPTMKVLLVDDFVTKGRTILAAATVLCREPPGF
jgi:hypothetical protein